MIGIGIALGLVGVSTLGYGIYRRVYGAKKDKLATPLMIIGIFVLALGIGLVIYKEIAKASVASDTAATMRDQAALDLERFGNPQLVAAHKQSTAQGLADCKARCPKRNLFGFGKAIRCENDCYDAWNVTKTR